MKKVIFNNAEMVFKQRHWYWQLELEKYPYKKEKVIFNREIGEKIIFKDGSYGLICNSGNTFIVMYGDFNSDIPIGMAGKYQSTIKNNWIVNPTVEAISSIEQELYHENQDIICWQFEDNSFLIYIKYNNIFVSVTEKLALDFMGL